MYDVICVDDGLQDVLDSFRLVLYICEPTRMLVISSTSSPSMIQGWCLKPVDDTSLVSNHQRLHCKLRLNRPTSHLVVITFRRLSKIDCTEFEGSLLWSSLFLNPDSMADTFTDQFAFVVTEELDRVASLRTTTRRQSITRWLSKVAVAAKREGRRLENLWKVRHLVDYRQRCYSTTKVINASRRDHYQQQLNNTSSAVKRWKITNELHSADRDETSTDEKKPASGFSDFF